jgi:hypothetical protein
MDISIITPSYAPDFERCKLLCKSIDKYVSNFKKHIIIVDRSDYQLFSSLKNATTEIIIKEDILPAWIYKMPFSKKWWFSLKSLPVRGWILQQLVKLSVHEFVDADVYMFADSDVAFIRPFDASTIISEDGVRLCSLTRKSEDYSDKRKQSWHLQAGKLFGIEDETQLNKDYISQLVCWRRDVLANMTNYISETAGMNWKIHLSRFLDLSEYTLYGIFTEHVLKEVSGHYRDDKELCYCSWHYDIKNSHDLDEFISTVPIDFNSILIQSNLKISTEHYKSVINRNYKL